MMCRMCLQHHPPAVRMHHVAHGQEMHCLAETRPALQIVVAPATGWRFGIAAVAVPRGRLPGRSAAPGRQSLGPRAVWEHQWRVPGVDKQEMVAVGKEEGYRTTPCTHHNSCITIAAQQPPKFGRVELPATLYVSIVHVKWLDQTIGLGCASRMDDT